MNYYPMSNTDICTNLDIIIYYHSPDHRKTANLKFSLSSTICSKLYFTSLSCTIAHHRSLGLKENQVVQPLCWGWLSFYICRAFWICLSKPFYYHWCCHRLHWNQEMWIHAVDRSDYKLLRSCHLFWMLLWNSFDLNLQTVYFLWIHPDSFIQYVILFLSWCISKQTRNLLRLFWNLIHFCIFRNHQT